MEKERRKKYRGAIILTSPEKTSFFLPRGDDFLNASSEEDAKRLIDLALGSISTRDRCPF